MPDSALVAALVARSARVAAPLVQARTEAEMLDAVTITRTTGKPGFDRATGKPTAAATQTVYSGKAHVWQVTGGTSYELGEEPTGAASTYIAIPLGAALPQRLDEVSINVSMDPQIIGRRFTVDSVSVGGLIPASRRLEVTGIEPGPNTVAP